MNRIKETHIFLKHKLEKMTVPFQEAERERLRKNNRLCTSVIVIFGACWLPLNVINILVDVSPDALLCWRYHHAAFFACHVVAMTSNCYNPFLYGWLNDAFRSVLIIFWRGDIRVISEVFCNWTLTACLLHVCLVQVGHLSS